MRYAQTPAELLASLPTDKLREIHDAIVTAELRMLNGNPDYQKIFGTLAKKSSGRQKKIYTALRKGRHQDLVEAFDLRAQAIKK